MTASLAHRGPDGEGTWSEANWALGHRRLAIIDLATGGQPMANEDGSILITYNGELYNFLDLRARLADQGHCFRTKSDTEVIIHAYEEWGDSCVELFRGMFAFGILDKRRNRLFLARDHFGIKPLVYYSGPHCFAFASEIQALKHVEDARFDVDPSAIDQYLKRQYIPAPHTIFKQVHKLPPGHRMAVTIDGQISGPQEYWRPKFAPEPGRSEEDWVEELDATLSDSVQAHLVSDVPFGIFLSGGVDSSCVTAHMARSLNQRIKTFTVIFDEEDYSEKEHAAFVAQRWGAEHHVELVRPNAIEILPSLVRHYGEPFGDKSALPTYYVCKMARQHVPMVLSGDGGDEAFAGYSSYVAWLDWLEYSKPPLWKRILRPLAEWGFPQHYPPRRPTVANWFAFNSVLNDGQRRRLWRPEYHDVVTSFQQDAEDDHRWSEHYSTCHRAQYLDMRYYLPFAILTKVDIASMMHGLEVRTPLVDLRVFELAMRMPEAVCMKRNTSGQWAGKAILKKSLEKYYPAAFLSRPKMGFDVPLRKWFSSAGQLRPLIEERLLTRSAMVNEYLRPAAILGLVQKNSYSILWFLLFLEEWLRQNKQI